MICIIRLRLIAPLFIADWLIASMNFQRFTPICDTLIENLSPPRVIKMSSNLAPFLAVRLKSHLKISLVLMQEHSLSVTTNVFEVVTNRPSYLCLNVL